MEENNENNSGIGVSSCENKNVSANRNGMKRAGAHHQRNGIGIKRLMWREEK